MFELGQRNGRDGKRGRHREKHFFTAVILVVITFKTDYEKCVRFEVEVGDVVFYTILIVFLKVLLKEIQAIYNIYLLLKCTRM